MIVAFIGFVAEGSIAPLVESWHQSGLTFFLDLIAFVVVVVSAFNRCRDVWTIGWGEEELPIQEILFRFCLSLIPVTVYYALPGLPFESLFWTLF